MTTYSHPCQLCGSPIERKFPEVPPKGFTCFPCKSKRQKKYAEDKYSRLSPLQKKMFYKRRKLREMAKKPKVYAKKKLESYETRIPMNVLYFKPRKYGKKALAIYKDE